MPNLKARLLSGWVGDRLLNDTVVETTEALGAPFRRLRLHAEWLAKTAPAAGDKVQVFVPELGTRTYTPFEADLQRGTFSLLVYLRAGAETSWASRLAPGDPLRMLRPEGSTPLAPLTGPVALFGDETSFALARCLLDLSTAAPVALCLEVATLADSVGAGNALGLPSAALLQRQSDDGHLKEVAARLAAATANGGTILLTGRARSIQQLKQSLKSGPAKCVTRPYWAEGKRGLD